uniref:Uncharacterized protein n=1 Tax=Octopus bimaculoides TaxID=37653 RepID=A0A0L8HF56_OCTBM
MEYHCSFTSSFLRSCLLKHSVFKLSLDLAHILKIHWSKRTARTKLEMMPTARSFHAVIINKDKQDRNLFGQ